MIGWNYIYIELKPPATCYHGPSQRGPTDTWVPTAAKKKLLFHQRDELYMYHVLTYIHVYVLYIYIYVWMICYQKTHDENRLVSWVHMFQTCTTHCHIVFLWANGARGPRFLLPTKGIIGIKKLPADGTTMVWFYLLWLRTDSQNLVHNFHGIHGIPWCHGISIYQRLPNDIECDGIFCFQWFNCFFVVFSGGSLPYKWRFHSIQVGEGTLW